MDKSDLPQIDVSLRVTQLPAWHTHFDYVEKGEVYIGEKGRISRTSIKYFSSDEEAQKFADKFLEKKQGFALTLCIATPRLRINGRIVHDPVLQNGVNFEFKDDFNVRVIGPDDD